MIDKLRPYHGTLWLAEPKRLKQAALKVLTVRPCPSPRELAELRRDRMTEALRNTYAMENVLPLLM